MTAPDPKSIDLSQLQPGPIRNKSLPPELLEHIKAIYDVVGPYLDTTREQFEIRQVKPREQTIAPKTSARVEVRAEVRKNSKNDQTVKQQFNVETPLATRLSEYAIVFRDSLA